MTTQTMIDEFLSQRRIAIVGVSRNPSDYSRAVFRKFLQLGYDTVPVNPNTAEVDGIDCRASVCEIKPVPDAVLLLTSPQATLGELEDCSLAGVKRVWSRRVFDAAAQQFCDQNVISAIDGYCPFLFFPDSGGIHKFHGFVLKILGKYPASNNRLRPQPQP